MQPSTDAGLPPLHPLNVSDLASNPQMASSSSPSRTMTSLTPAPPHTASLASSTSKESFATAHTSASPLSTPTETGSDFSPVSPATRTRLAPQAGLRKSVSVDSFPDYNQGSTSPRRATRPGRVNTGSALAPPRHLHTPISAGIPRDRDHRQVDDGTRPSGSTISTAVAESLGDEFDQEREAEVPAKKSDHSRPIRPGHLVLPARGVALSSASSMSSLGSGPSSPSPRESSHRLQSTSSMQSIARTSSSIAESRSRSGSLSVAGALERGMGRTGSTIHDPSRIEFPIIVIGDEGCGKSTVIHKGLKQYRLSETTNESAEWVPGGPAVHYRKRISSNSPDENNPTRILHVMEIDSPALDFDNPSKFIWPTSAPQPFGMVVCYDATSVESFSPVETVLMKFRSLNLPTIVLATKSDPEGPRALNPQDTLEIIRTYDVGLVEVTVKNDDGKNKMRRAFDWLFKAMFREPQRFGLDTSTRLRNPASPDILTAPHPPWDSPRSAAATPTALTSTQSMQTVAAVQAAAQASSSRARPSSPVAQTPRSPSTPSRARSTSDLLSEHERSKKQERRDSTSRNVMSLGVTGSAVSLHEPGTGSVPLNSVEEAREEKKEAEEKDVARSRPAQWATLEELLDKLIFLAVSGDDPSFISHFLLTYRRFASPRSILLAMQKRMRQLDNPAGDPMFACYSQMRICALLETWIRDYPYDFAVRGTAGALSALIKSIIGKTYLLHYGSDFLPFLEVLPSLVDMDTSWAMKVEDPGYENDEYNADDDEEAVPEPVHVVEPESPTSSERGPRLSNGNKSSTSVGTRERKASLPLTAKALITSNTPQDVALAPGEYVDIAPKQQLRELLKLSQDVQALDSTDIAQEITRLEVKLFLDIHPRHWLQFTLASGRKDPMHDTIARYNQVSNHIAEWVASLILCHDKARSRAKQVEKLVEIASKLRNLNNYSALRAFVAGINTATYQGDPTIEIFKAKSPDGWKTFQSWDLLLQQRRSHHSYRMALRNSKGACIPALEVHMSDLIRAHEGNPDSSPNHPDKIHWAKYNMMGKFIMGSIQCQNQCRDSADYNFPERPHIKDVLLREHILMDPEMQQSRITPPDIDDMDAPTFTTPRTTVLRDTSHLKNPLIFRKMLQW